MSDAFTLTILGADAHDQPPSHESSHTNVSAAFSKLESILREADTGDLAVPDPENWSDQRPAFDLIDVHGEHVGTAVIERD
ncbi:hypothetical protein [Rhodococcus sp. NCIMB 12038]|uniref:hypothetical protein n=1 Tax=Rhodococcus sp. NCIMB 12038 TaxID=933800 RepID=UPI000B3C7D08|nr:hypothetical protein [Rhodococcus sp. NCIMB 12038]OUS97255.1 hypothetical protein CA951_02600 [Rhodococcus sp. NCIMB 12038]